MDFGHFTNIFHSESEARAQIKAWRKEYPGSRYRIEQIAVGNRVGWHVIQVNRFSESGK